MFVRKKKNKSGKISVQVIDKSSGRYRVVKTIGSSANADEVEVLVNEGKQWIGQQLGQAQLDLEGHQASFSTFVSHIKEIRIAGTDLLLGQIFDQIGFNQISDTLFRQLVFARICFPFSKLKTTDYLRRYYGQEVDEDQIYYYMDKLYAGQKELIEQISFEHTRKILGRPLQIVFYDVTTLYFEIDQEDELRKTGFSKEGKHQHPQVVLGLLVSVHGYPLAYEVFEGNQFEGHTMLPVIEAFKARYALKDLAIIADSGLFSNQNISLLQEQGYQFILGARIKNEKETLKKQILSLDLQDGKSKVIKRSDGLQLVISYASSRARKDKRNRERGLHRLEKKLKSGKLNKSHINNRGYNKYLKMQGDIDISIDRQKFKKDGQWDGLKGYLTNTDLSSEDIIANYKELWKIEKAFRIAKSDLKIRPVYHRKDRRIKTHICISFVAYKVYKELERQLRLKKTDLSPEKAIEIAKTIYSIRVKLPQSKKVMEETLLLNEEQKFVAKLFDF